MKKDLPTIGRELLESILLTYDILNDIAGCQRFLAWPAPPDLNNN